MSKKWFLKTVYVERYNGDDIHSTKADLSYYGPFLYNDDGSVSSPDGGITVVIERVAGSEHHVYQRAKDGTKYYLGYTEEYPFMTAGEMAWLDFVDLMNMRDWYYPEPGRKCSPCQSVEWENAQYVEQDLPF